MRRLMRAQSGLDFKERFNELMRERFGAEADSAWAILEKFIGHGMGINAVMVLEVGHEHGQLAKAVEDLTTLWREEVEEKNLPALDAMSDLQEEAMANSFQIISRFLRVR